MLVDVQGFLFVAGHEVDVELSDADFAQAVELLAMFLNGTNDAEAVDDLVGNEIGIVTADFTMVEIIVLAAVFHIGREAGRKFLRLVLGDEYHTVFGTEGRKPSD